MDENNKGKTTTVFPFEPEPRPVNSLPSVCTSIITDQKNLFRPVGHQPEGCGKTFTLDTMPLQTGPVPVGRSVEVRWVTAAKWGRGVIHDEYWWSLWASTIDLYGPVVERVATHKCTADPNLKLILYIYIVLRHKTTHILDSNTLSTVL